MTDTRATPLDPRHRSALTAHGSAAVLVGMVGGLGFLFNILRFIEVFPLVPRINKQIPGTEQAWRTAHTGPIMNGMLAMAIRASGSMITLSPRAQRGLVATMLITIWCNTIGYNAAAIGGERGLTPRGRPLNNIAYVCFLAAAVSVLVSILLVIIGARRNRQDDNAAAPLTISTTGASC